MMKIIDKKITENIHPEKNKCLNNKNELYELNLHSFFFSLLYALRNIRELYILLNVFLFFLSLDSCFFLYGVFEVGQET